MAAWLVPVTVCIWRSSSEAPDQRWCVSMSTCVNTATGHGQTQGNYSCGDEVV